VIGSDGSEITVDSASFASGDELVTGIDRAVPRDRWITFA